MFDYGQGANWDYLDCLNEANDLKLQHQMLYLFNMFLKLWWICLIWLFYFSQIVLMQQKHICLIGSKSSKICSSITIKIYSSCLDRFQSQLLIRRSQNLMSSIFLRLEGDYWGGYFHLWTNTENNMALSKLLKCTYIIRYYLKWTVFPRISQRHIHLPSLNREMEWETRT